ncbi:WbqC family protein [Lunatibacter salilacus]|uniref:WbqC family protein n=1 Tax=Lunatibacter salilacus TaxID=2483804 RepID=UPI00131DD853|nr:WbqC family protein [Lunatibacter salilacus]
MVISIHQPNYFPWLGYFYKIHESDYFVILDDVQFNNEGLQNYHYIKTPQGSLRLKVPVKYNHGDVIKDVSINNSIDWRKKHLKTIEMNYKKSDYFDLIFKDYSDIIYSVDDSIADLCTASIKFICDKFNFKTKIISSSTLGIDSAKTQRVVDICLALKGTQYLSGHGAKVYQDESLFERSSLGLSYSKFSPIHYKQLWNEEFQSNVSILDYLMNMGYNWDFIIENTENGNR